MKKLVSLMLAAALLSAPAISAHAYSSHHWQGLMDCLHDGLASCHYAMGFTPAPHMPIIFPTGANLQPRPLLPLRNPLPLVLLPTVAAQMLQRQIPITLSRYLHLFPLQRLLLQHQFPLLQHRFPLLLRPSPL